MYIVGWWLVAAEYTGYRWWWAGYRYSPHMLPLESRVCASAAVPGAAGAATEKRNPTISRTRPPQAAPGERRREKASRLKTGTDLPSSSLLPPQVHCQQEI